MIVSTKGRYALRVMVRLALDRADGYIPLKEIAEAEGISQKYLEAIKNALKDYFDKNNIPYDPADFPELDHDELHDAVHGED